MIKNYDQFTNEDLRSKKIIYQFGDNLKSLYPSIQLIHTDDLKVVISCNETLKLLGDFYEVLEKDYINKDDIIFENCEKISLWTNTRFTSIKEYGAFGNNISNFSCSYCQYLTTLEGAPKEVGIFNCGNCEITSLEFAPTVADNFYCAHCTNLTNLDGAPKKLSGSFYCAYCTNLTNLDGAPKHVSGNFECIGCKNLTSLEGAPNFIGNYFYCKKCNPNFIKLAIEKYENKVRA